MVIFGRPGFYTTETRSVYASGTRGFCVQYCKVLEEIKSFLSYHFFDILRDKNLLLFFFFLTAEIGLVYRAHTAQ